MTVAFLVHCEVKDGTPMSVVKRAINNALTIDIDNEARQPFYSANIDANSAVEYNPDHGGVCVYQP